MLNPMELKQETLKSPLLGGPFDLVSRVSKVGYGGV